MQGALVANYPYDGSPGARYYVFLPSFFHMEDTSCSFAWVLPEECCRALEGGTHSSVMLS